MTRRTVTAFTKTLARALGKAERGKGQVFGVRHIWAGVPASLLMSFVTLGQLFNLNKP